MYQSGVRTNYSTDFCLAQLIDFILSSINKTDTCVHDIIRSSEGVCFFRPWSYPYSPNILVSGHP